MLGNLPVEGCSGTSTSPWMVARLRRRNRAAALLRRLVLLLDPGPYEDKDARGVTTQGLPDIHWI